MSATGDKKNLFMLTLKGRVTVQFVDGNTLEGEFVTQDELNIFIKIDHEPVMIPRSQIRYIKGKPDQFIEKDESQAVLLETGAGEAAPETKEAKTLLPGPDILTGTQQRLVLVEEEGQPTDPITLDQAAAPQKEEAIKPQDTGVISEEEEDEDPTLVLKQEQPKAELEEATLILKIKEPETEKISAYLDCASGPHAGEVFELTEDVTTIGRSSDNILPLSNDKEISRKHSKIIYESGTFIIEDQNSLNGTFVNDQRVESPRYLEDGDVILVGVSTLVYHQK